MRLVQENSNIGYDEPDSSEVSKLQKITDNILNGTVPADQQDEMILQVLQGNPRAFELYRLLAVKYGDEDGTLEAMAECFDYPEFAAYKLGLLDKKFDDALSATHTDEQDIFDLKAKIEAYAARLSVNPEKQLARLKAQWDVLDRNPPHRLQERNIKRVRKLRTSAMTLQCAISLPHNTISQR